MLGWTRDRKGSWPKDQLPLEALKLRGKPGPPEPLSQRVSGPCAETGVRYLGVGRSRELPEWLPALEISMHCNKNYHNLLVNAARSVKHCSRRAGGRRRLSALSTPSQPAVRALEISMQMVLIQRASCQAAHMASSL